MHADDAIVIEPSAAAGIPRLADVRDAGAARIVCVLTGADVSREAHREIVATRGRR